MNSVLWFYYPTVTFHHHPPLFFISFLSPCPLISLYLKFSEKFESPLQYFQESLHPWCSVASVLQRWSNPHEHNVSFFPLSVWVQQVLWFVRHHSVQRNFKCSNFPQTHSSESILPMQVSLILKERDECCSSGFTSLKEWFIDPCWKQPALLTTGSRVQMGAVFPFLCKQNGIDCLRTSTFSLGSFHFSDFCHSQCLWKEEINGPCKIVQRRTGKASQDFGLILTVLH